MKKLIHLSEMISSSDKAKRTFNPIRNVVDKIKKSENHCKEYVNLALGDPTIHGNLKCPKVLEIALQDALLSGESNGYGASVGCSAGRKAIASKVSRTAFDALSRWDKEVIGINPCFNVENYFSSAEITEDDVIITSGCSGAIELAISVLLNEGDNMLVPRPGFPLYRVIIEAFGGFVKEYPLNPDGWECDTVVMNMLIDNKTKAIIITNPSNPCGSNFSPEHLISIIKVAKKHNLPIIADEIYGGCVFDGLFTPIACLSKDVLVLSLGGLAKEFVVPGWRLGWITIHHNSSDDNSNNDSNDDNEEGANGSYSNRERNLLHDDLNTITDIRTGLSNLSQLTLGASTLFQSVLPRVLNPIEGSEDSISLQQFHDYYMLTLNENTQMCVDYIKARIPELSMSIPKAAMYAMLQIRLESFRDILNDKEFTEKLLLEENLSVLPGEILPC